MSIPQNFTQTIEQLKRDIEKEVNNLREKETAQRNAVLEKQKLEESVKAKEAELKQKEGELQRFKAEVQQFALQTRSKISQAERDSRKLIEEINTLKREQSAKSQELTKVQMDFQNSLKGKK